MFYKLPMIVASILVGVAPFPTYAAELVTSRADFLLGSQKVVTRDFNDVVDDLSFNNSIARYKDITLSTNMPGYEANNGNAIHPTAALSFYSIDGSTFAEFDLLEHSTATIKFDKISPLVGFSVFGLANEHSTTLSFFDVNDSLLVAFPLFGPQLGGAGINGFLGFRSDAGIKSIRFTFNGPTTNDYFGVDNILTAETAVPEPASWSMIILGMGVVGGALRRRNKTAMRVSVAAQSSTSD